MSSGLDSLLQRPLYVWDLPQELLDTLELKAQASTAAPTAEETTEISTNGNAANTETSTSEGAPAAATSCALCGLTFPTLQDQRNHVRSDLHGYNLKQKLRGVKSIGEHEFEKLVGDLDESISGSDDTSSDSSADEQENGTPKRKETTLSALLKKQANLADPDAEETGSKKRKRGSGKAPILWFSSSRLPSNTSLGIYRSLFTPAEQIADSATLLQTLQRKQLSPKPPPTQPTSETTEESGGVPLPRSLQPNTSATGPHYFLCMIGGGHFAGMLVSLTPKVTQKIGIQDRAATVLAHKTFHRYTTRRKQGGSQSANDSAKGAAHSAGSSLRRYNETALVSEVRQLLQEWKKWIDTSELLFVRATGTTNRRTLFGPYDDQVMSLNDERIRSFPFNTRRATQAELMRAFVELTRVKVSQVDEAALAAQAAQAEAEAVQKAEKASAAAAKAAKPSVPKPSKEEEEASLHTTQLQSLVRRSKAPALLSYLTSNNLNPNFVFHPQDAPQYYHAPTSLHLAASLNSAACITALLVKAHADPTITSKEGKTAFEISGDRATRDAFRLARTELGESAWDWNAAGVPAGLSKEEVEKRAQRERDEAETEKNAEVARRKEEMERLRKEDRKREEEGREKRFGKGKTVVGLSAGAEKTAQERREEEARGMTDQMRMRLERERRARAAEARIKK